VFELFAAERTDRGNKRSVGKRKSIVQSKKVEQPGPQPFKSAL